MITFRQLILSLVLSAVAGISAARAQEQLPFDNGLEDYHTSPRYRESESHPLRVLAYALHPIGWAARELIFRPLSYFASSTPETRSIMGYREPYDFRRPSCFSARDEVPDCRQLVPFNYEDTAKVGGAPAQSDVQAIYLPDTNFDFNKRKLNALGKAKVRSVSEVLKREGGVKVVLEGHADARGSEAYNQKLGLDRAEAVKSELVSLGVSADRLSTVSFGETRPLFTEQEDWAYSANRRVEVHMEGKTPDSPATRSQQR